MKKSNVPFVNEVEDFNELMSKPNNYTPTIPEKKEWQFVYDFVLEELEEYKEACEKGDIVEILDALCDIAYVSLGNGTMLHGLKDKIWPAYQEVQASNMSKACKTQEEAVNTVKVRSQEQGEPCHWEQVGDMYIVYRTRDRKVMKSLTYFRPDLNQFFTDEEINNSIK
jgi:predicted HAD superfamily Cof-like phosphohydrolase